MSKRNGTKTAAEAEQPTIEDLAAETAAAAPGPEVIEGGRYKVSRAPDGSWIIARATGTCDRCQGCGCGDQAELIQVPAMVVSLAQSGGTGLMGKLKALRGAGALLPED